MFLPSILSLSLLTLPTTMAATTDPDTKQISPLPKPTRYITTHNSAAESVIHAEDAATWTSLDGNKMGFYVPYTTSQFPVDMNNGTDITQNNEVISSGKLGLVNPSGTVCRYVDFAPGNRPIMHQTVSLDYGIVLDGEVEMELDSGEKRVLKRGDIAVQRGTKHAWRNPSETEWARLLFVLQASEKIAIDGKELKEDIPSDTDDQSSQ